VVGNDLLNTLMIDAGVGDPYDIRKQSDPTDPLQDALGTYLNLPETRKKLDVGTSGYLSTSCIISFYLLYDV
jgi:hypothetical protein